MASACSADQTHSPAITRSAGVARRRTSIRPIMTSAGSQMIGANAPERIGHASTRTAAPANSPTLCARRTAWASITGTHA